MKKIFSLFLASVVLCLFASCTATLPYRFDSFVSSVEKHYESYSEDDWNKANDKFEKLLEEYKENRSSLNSDQKKQINDALVRYGKVVAKSGIQSISATFNEIASQIPGIIEDAKSFFHEMGVTLGINE